MEEAKYLDEVVSCERIAVQRNFLQVKYLDSF